MWVPAGSSLSLLERYRLGGGRKRPEAGLVSTVCGLRSPHSWKRWPPACGVPISLSRLAGPSSVSSCKDVPQGCGLWGGQPAPLPPGGLGLRALRLWLCSQVPADQGPMGTKDQKPQPPQVSSVPRLQRKLKEAAREIVRLRLEKEQLLETGNRLRAELGRGPGERGVGGSGASRTCSLLACRPEGGKLCRPAARTGRGRAWPGFSGGRTEASLVE